MQNRKQLNNSYKLDLHIQFLVRYNFISITNVYYCCFLLGHKSFQLRNHRNMTSTRVQVQLMLRLMEQIPGSFVQIQSAKSNKEIVQKKKEAYRENYLKFSLILFLIYYSIHAVLVVVHFRNGHLKLSGPLLAYLMLE